MDHASPGFSRRLGLDDLKLFRRVAFRAAYFWHMTPSELMATPIDLLIVALEEMVEIREELEGAN